MRIVANEKYIARRVAFGKYASFGGIGVLFVALIFSFTRPGSILAMEVALLGAMMIGILLSFIGGYYVERFAGVAPHHLKVREALKGLDRQYVLFQYTLPSPHVLLGPDGLTVVVAKSQGGTIAYADGKWSHQQKGRFFRQLVGQEGLGRPEQEVAYQVDRLRGYLEKTLPGVDVPVRGLVLFVHPDVQLAANDPPVPVFYGKKVRAWLRGPGKVLPAALRQQLEQKLIGSSAVAEET